MILYNWFLQALERKDGFCDDVKNLRGRFAHVLDAKDGVVSAEHSAIVHIPKSPNDMARYTA